MPGPTRSAFSIERMLATHADQALQLCRTAGWNQLRNDWLRLISHEPRGCFVAVSEETVIGTVTTTRYGSELAWIGMMLVHPRFRRHGIATALMQHSIDYLRSHGVQCIKLDATPVGEKVYKQLGFKSEWAFNRWSRAGSNSAALIAASKEPTGSGVVLRRTAFELDRSAFGADRSEYIQRLADGSLVQAVSGGYGMSRPGYLATYLGPVVANSPTIAHLIICEQCESTNRTVFWDIPGPNLEAIRIAQSLGFAPVRDLTRMRLGHSPSQPNIKLQYALADPGTG